MEKHRVLTTQSPSLFDAPGTEALALQNKCLSQTPIHVYKTFDLLKTQLKSPSPKSLADPSKYPHIPTQATPTLKSLWPDWFRPKCEALACLTN